MNKDILKALNFLPKENTSGIFVKKYGDGYSIEVDFEKELINYGNKIKSESKTTSNFSQAENWVVLECVDRLLVKGYKPEDITLEKVFPSGHGHSGRLDIFVEKEKKSFLMIECKTYGREFDKEYKNIQKDGGQLFTYFQNDKNTDFLMLYASQFNEHTKSIEYKNEIVVIEDAHKETANVKDFFDRWNKFTKNNGIFENGIFAYKFESKSLRLVDIKNIQQEDSSFIFNRFIEILRHNAVSDKPNAFNKIFTLFLCKVKDEDKNLEEELDFQWREGEDDNVSFQKRLSDLYKKAMKEFLDKEVSDFSDADFDSKYKHLSSLDRKNLLDEITKLRLQKNNEFAIKDVFDEETFVENGAVLKEVVELLQNYRFRYNKKQPFLGDFFELLLNTGLKQESGQFFTPVPIARFICRSVPLKESIENKLGKSETKELLPNIIDYAAGSGHFLTEAMEEIQSIIENIETSKLTPKTKDEISVWKTKQFAWAFDYIYGIERDYRLVKTTKVGCYLHGDGVANIIHADGLDSFDSDKYLQKLHKKNANTKDNAMFDFVLSNPPYSVSSFKGNSEASAETSDMYDFLTDNSSEIECLFIERTKQLLKDGGVAGIILPSSILSNTGIYTKSRELILQYFNIIAVAELGSNTFMATGTNTVILFLKKKNNYEFIAIKNSVGLFLNNLQDLTIGGVENSVSKYVSHVWKNVNFQDYVTFLNKEPNQNILSHEIFVEYKKKTKTKNEKDFWEDILRIESEKISYFIVAYPQKVVLVKSGEKDSEKRFLGYGFSNRRGSEGIHPIQRGKSIDECTQLFDPESFYNPAKASTYILKAFEGDFDFPIDESMKNNVSRHDLVDMLTFDRVDFEKSISLSLKKKIKMESKWKTEKLNELAEIKGGNGFPKEYQNNKNTEDVPFYKVSDMNTGINKLTMTLSNNYVDKNVILDKIKAVIFPINTVIFPKVGKAIDTNKKRILGRAGCVDNNVMGLIVRDEKVLSAKFLFNYFVNNIKLLDIASNANPPSISAANLKELEIPLPPLEIQQKIVSEIEALEEKEKKAKEEIEKLKNSIKSMLIFRNKINCKLGDIVSLEYGISLPDNQRRKGLYPVVGSNGIVGSHDTFLVPNEAIIVGRKGSAGKVNFIKESCTPIDTTFYVKLLNNHYSLNLIFHILKNLNLEKITSGVGVPGLNRNDAYALDIALPEESEQQKIVTEIEKIEVKIKMLETEIAEVPKQKEAILKRYL